MIALARHPTREKDDVVEWAGMPPGPCDMNFRPASAGRNTSPITCSFLGLAAIVPVIAIMAAHALLAVPPSVLSNWEVIGWGAIAALIPLILNRVKLLRTSAMRICYSFVQIVLVEFVASGWFPDQKGIVYLAWFVFSVLPQLIFIADLVASHNIYWNSASPNLDLKLLTAIRKFWDARCCISALPAINSKDRKARDISDAKALFRICSFYSRHLLLVIAVLGVTLLIVGIATEFDLVAILLGAAFALFVSTIVLNLHFPGMISVVSNAIKRSLGYYFLTRQPPWVFRSPAGSAFKRVASYLIVLFFVSAFVNSCLWASIEHVSWIYSASISVKVIAVACYLFVFVVLPNALLFCAIAVLIGPTLWAFEQACEGDGAALKRKGWTDFDGYVDRIINSSNPYERKSVWIGFHKTLGFPILLDIELVREHMHILGATGSGKTGLGISTLVAQLIKRGDGPVVILDCKGDRALLHSANEWTTQADRKFKWFTTTHGKSTYIFNPFDQKHLHAMTIQELVGFFLLAFNLNHGEGYGRSWFAVVAKAAFYATLKSSAGERPKTFKQIQRLIEIIVGEHRGEYEAAKQLMFVMRSLAEFSQINMTKATHDNPACEHAIHMPEVIEKKQVVYFNLESLTDPSTAGEISRLATYSIISAAREYQDRTGKKANVYLVIDEAQEVIAKNISKALEQARSCGVTCILSHQSLSQLNTPDADLRSIVTECTCSKLYFSARDPDTKKFLADISGEVGYYTASWKQFVFRMQQGIVNMNRAVSPIGEPAIADVSEKIGPRLAEDDISEASRSPNQSIISIQRYEGFSRYRGAFPIHIDYPMSQADYERRRSTTPWPTAAGETIDTQSFWPDDDVGETIIATRPQPSPDFAEQALTPEDLDTLKRKLIGRENTE